MPGRCRGPVRRDVVLRCEDVTAGYVHKPVVREANLEVRAGQIVTLIGPNGAGKSTLLKTIAGSLGKQGGAVYLVGKRLEELSVLEQARVRSVLLTERPRTELLTCCDVVRLGRQPHTGRFGTLSEIDQKAVRRAMELLQVEDLAEQQFMRLSDGQRQRVMLARALCQDPRLLVLDEPTSYLDIRYQIELFDVLRSIVAEGKLGIVMTLHELTLARQVSDWVACIKDGVVVAQGTPQEVFTSAVIDDLYDLEPGSFDPLTGAISIGCRAERMPEGGASHEAT